MFDQIKNFIVDNSALFISGLALWISILAWHKSRAIYDIELWPVRGDTIKDIRKRLSTGKWTIFSFQQKMVGPRFGYDSMLLVRIKGESFLTRFLKAVKELVRKLRGV